jgi:hypothetical protein
MQGPGRFGLILHSETATLIHEIWEAVGDNGQLRPSHCLAGSDGDGFHRLLHEDTQKADAPTRCLICSFEAEGHFEAMTIYDRHYGWANTRRNSFRIGSHIATKMGKVPALEQIKNTLASL